MHLSALLAIAAISAAVAIALPEFLPLDVAGSPTALGVVAGAMAFLAGALALEIAARRGGEKRAEAERRFLAEQTRKLLEDMRKVEGVQRSQRVAPDPTAELEAMAGEMTMLKSLVEQLHKSGPVDTASAGEPLGFHRGARGYRPPVQRFDDEEEALARVPIDLDDDEALLDLVCDALDNDSVDLFLEPIVSLPQRRVRYYRCEPRIRAGDNVHIPASRYMPVAEQSGLLAAIDNMLLFRAVQLVRRARRRQSPTGFFCTISGETLNDRRFFMDFTGFMGDNRDLAGYLVFAMAQADVYKLIAPQQAELARLARLGFRFCLEKVTNPELFVSDLSEQGFRYVDIDAKTLIRRCAGGEPRALKRGLDRGAIDLIVSDVHAEDTLLDVLDFGVDFGIGRIFGQPQPAEVH